MREFVTCHDDPTHPGVAALVLSRPPSNAVTRQVCREITAAAAELAGRAEVRAVVVFGGHEVFCTGADAAERAALAPGERATLAVSLDAAVAALAALPTPVVCAITGYALGAGLALALAADRRVAGDNAKFGLPDIADGASPEPATAQLLARAIGEGAARDLAFSGRFADAPEALALGLIDEMVAPDEVYDRAVAWAAGFAALPAAALAATKAAFGPR